MIKLSICIPVYNMDIYLDEALKSISHELANFPEVKSLVEVCISNNASSDKTADVIQKWKQSLPIIAHENEMNLGCDQNFIDVINMASGQYCWYLGGDDALLTGALRKVFSLLDKCLDIILANRTECDKSLNPMRINLWLRGHRQYWNTKKISDQVDYLRRIKSMGGLFSYLSSLLFRKDAWTQVDYQNKFTGTGYSHVSMMLGMFKQGVRLWYCEESLVLCRDNDVFSSAFGSTNRLILDLRGYGAFIEHFFPDSQNVVHREMLRVIRRDHGMKNVASFRSREEDSGKWGEVEPYLKFFKYPGWFIFFMRNRKFAKWFARF